MVGPNLPFGGLACGLVLGPSSITGCLYGFAGDQVEVRGYTSAKRLKEYSLLSAGSRLNAFVKNSVAFLKLI